MQSGLSSQPQSPVVQDFVLVGGGHSHAIALRKWGMQPIGGVRVTLVSEVMHTPYSGMLPGYVAGLYAFDECHIDLRPLAQFAQVQLVHDRAVGLDLPNQQVLFADRPPIAFDWLSLDIGSTPTPLTTPGANLAIPVKPIPQFLAAWERLLAQVRQHPDRPLRLAIVGGGAGGVELMLAMRARLAQLLPPHLLTLHLLHRGDRLVPERSPSLSRQLHRVLVDRGVQVHLQTEVVAIEPIEVQAIEVQAVDPERFAPEKSVAAQFIKRLRLTSGERDAEPLLCDHVFWVTQAAAAPWLREAGLATDDRGFVQVDQTLRSISHPCVFAAGDTASLLNFPRPKAGVFAVRQAQPLFDNWQRSLLEKPLRSFTPQQHYLILLGRGDRAALASRGQFSLPPLPWLWRWKESIDRRFMQQFAELPVMSSGDRTSGWTSGWIGLRREPAQLRLALPAAQPKMHCAGCGSKVGSTVLQKALHRVRSQAAWIDRADVLLGLDAADDAAVVQIPSDRVLVQTLDQFRSLVSDPFVFGQICTHHCLSDLFAMGADPQTALASVTLPYATPEKLEESLVQLLAGVVRALSQAGATLVGGHTTEGAELSLGLVCNGLATLDKLWKKSGMQPGQALILTKPIGTGTLFAADMQHQAKGRWIEGAIDSMLQSNQAAAACLRQHQATACTDVTGFGLAGHLLELVRASQVSVRLDLAALPILAGAIETIRAGFLSSLHQQNAAAAAAIAPPTSATDPAACTLLFDPQTSGGLLASVPAEQASACVSALQAIGYAHSRVIGQVQLLGDWAIELEES